MNKYGYIANKITLWFVRFLLKIIYAIFDYKNDKSISIYNRNILIVKNLMNQIGAITNTKVEAELCVQIYDIGEKNLVVEECYPTQQDRIELYTRWKIMFEKIIEKYNQKSEGI